MSKNSHGWDWAGKRVEKVPPIRWRKQKDGAYRGSCGDLWFSARNHPTDGGEWTLYVDGFKISRSHDTPEECKEIAARWLATFRKAFP